MMVSMAGENGDGGAEASPARSAMDAAASLRIESVAIAWSARERIRTLAFRAMGASTMLAVVALGFSLAADSNLAAVVFGLSSVGAALSGGLGAFPRFGRGAKAGVVELRGEELRIAQYGALRRLDLTEVEQGWIEDVFGESEACDVVLRLRSERDVTVRVASRVVGESLLRAVRVSVADRVLRIPLRSAASSQRFGEVMGIASLGLLLPFLCAGSGGLIWFALMYLRRGGPFEQATGARLLAVLLLALSALSLFGVRFLARFLRRREVVVGTDGVAIEGFGKRRFLAYSRVRRIARDPRGVRLYLKDGVSMLLPTLAEANAPLPIAPGVDAPVDPASIQRGIPRSLILENLHRKDVARREALFERIDQAMRAQGQSRVAHVQLAELDRRSRSVSAWRDDLRALLAVEGSGYRGAALGPDQLAEVVEDAGAPTERRVAAAVALSGKGNEEAKRRVRVAVEACADRDLRAALEHAAEGEIEEAELHRAMKQRREVV